MIGAVVGQAPAVRQVEVQREQRLKSLSPSAADDVSRAARVVAARDATGERQALSA